MLLCMLGLDNLRTCAVVHPRAWTSLRRTSCSCPSTTTCTGAWSSFATLGRRRRTTHACPGSCTWTPCHVREPLPHQSCSWSSHLGFCELTGRESQSEALQLSPMCRSIFCSPLNPSAVCSWPPDVQDQEGAAGIPHPGVGLQGAHTSCPIPPTVEPQDLALIIPNLTLACSCILRVPN